LLVPVDARVIRESILGPSLEAIAAIVAHTISSVLPIAALAELFIIGLVATIGLILRRLGIVVLFSPRLVIITHPSCRRLSISVL